MIGTVTQHLLRREMRAALACLAVMAATVAAFAYPRPASVPSRWELEFRAGELRLFRDAFDGDYYWYFTYTVTNRTGADQTWAPSFVLFTDAGEVLNSGINVPTRVMREVIDMHGRELMENQYEIIGEILQGREHAKEGAVIWPAQNLDVTDVSLFIGGISGETARIRNPITGEDVLLRKTLQRNYHIPGNAAARGPRPVDFVDQKWVFR